MSRILRAAGAAALTVALFAPTAAHGDQWASPDGESDVEGWTYDPQPEPCGTFTDFEAPEETHEDLTQLEVRHTRVAVIVTLRFRDLKASLEHSSTTYFRTPKGGYWLDVERYRRSGAWRTLTFLSKAPRYPSPDEVNECGIFSWGSVGIGCKIGRTVDAAADQVRIEVPRACLKNPRWVRVGADSMRFVEPESPTDPTFGAFTDEWDGGTVLTEWQISYGPRVLATTGAPIGRARTDTSGSQQRHFVVGRDGILARR
jgi:hypothetical protein